MAEITTTVPGKVLASLENEAADHCVDIFVRVDGTFGFEEYRRDHEDGRGWFPLHRYAHLIFKTEEDALAQARSRVAWLVVEGDSNGCDLGEA
jgi:hypothetical protein